MPQSSKWPADTVERRPIAGLIPAARNARTHSPERLFDGLDHGGLINHPGVRHCVMVRAERDQIARAVLSAFGFRDNVVNMGQE